LGRYIKPTREAVYAAIDEFDKSNDNMEAYINLKEFEVVELAALKQEIAKEKATR